MAKVYYSLYDRLLSTTALAEAFHKVKSAKGAPGIDGQSIKDFAGELEMNLAILARELKEKSYRAQPVRRVEIPKENGKTRQLGIPTVRDRVVQHALLDILNPIFDGDFHPSSYGYRPGRSCHQAIGKAELFTRRYNLKWVVDMDLSKCFDTLDHQLILDSVRKRVTDSSILRLLKQFLESGVMIGNSFEKSEKGSPQGGVISPLLANIYLDNFDRFTMERNYRIVRYADDILILCRSRKGALNALRKATGFLEKQLKLRVNREKTHIEHSSRGIKFLGVEICSGYTRIQAKKISNFKARIKRITRRNSPVNLEKVIKELNPVVRGFGNYFRIANCNGTFETLMGWIRRRLRAKQLKLWKNPRKLHRKLRQLGHEGGFKLMKMNSWRNACSIPSHLALPNSHFDRLGLFNLEKVKTGITVPLPEG